MAAYNLITTTTVGSGGASAITFTSIPQTYTDLLILHSTRTNRANIGDWLLFSFNGSTASFTERDLYGSGSAAGSSSSTPRYIAEIVGGNATASVFGNGVVYIPNYTSSNYKSYSADAVGENNATASFQVLIAGLWSNTAAITSITITPGSASTLSQYSSASLYGIKSS